MSNDTKILKLKNLSKFYYNKGTISSGLVKVNLEFDLGEFVAITGESGSGKSTLLNVISGLDSYEEGELYINGSETSHFRDNDFEDYRKTYIANIFQSFNLVNSYTVYQNIELVLLLNGYKRKGLHKKIINLIKQVDLYKYRHAKVSRLSGGQKQRVAIARALAKDTPIIIADEPTGNLDKKNSESVLKLLKEVSKNKLVVVVTHNYEQVEDLATRKIEMYDGRVREDIKLKDYEKATPTVNNFTKLSLANCIRLGVRNTFNIFFKFLLTFMIFAFVMLSFYFELSSLKNLQKESEESSANMIFDNINDKTRIVAIKKDRTPFTQEEIENIQNNNLVRKVNIYDALLDEYAMYELNDDYYYIFEGYINEIDNNLKLDLGTMPINDDEIIIKANEWEISEAGIELNKYISLDVANVTENFKVVGIIYNEDEYDYINDFYFSSNTLNKFMISYIDLETTTKVYTNNNLVNYPIKASEKVKEGEVVIPYEANEYCKYGWCKNKWFNIKTSNINTSKELSLKNTAYYTKKTQTEYDKTLEYSELYIYVSQADYEKLYKDDIYQISIFASSTDDVKALNESLKSQGYRTISMKEDAYSIEDQSEVIVRVLRIIITIILFIVLFVITFFLIRLIQKSKNVYYSTIRILGGTRKNIKHLISIELLTTFNVSYFAILIAMNKVNFIKNILSNIVPKECLFIYGITLCMCILISILYSRRLFNSSAMKAYNEEA